MITATLLHGVDLSSHTDPVDAARLVRGQVWVGLRATLGKSRPDTRYAEYRALAKAAGADVAAYLFLAGANRPNGGTYREQIDALLRVAPDADGYALDWEEDAYLVRTATGLLVQQTYGWMPLGDVRRSIDYMHQRGLRVGLYGSERGGSGYPTLGQDWRWIANISGSPSLPWDVHQYSFSPADMNRIRVPLSYLRARIAPSQPVKGTLVAEPGGYFRYNVRHRAGEWLIQDRHGYHTQGFRVHTDRAGALRWPKLGITRQVAHVYDPRSSYHGLWIGLNQRITVEAA